MKTYMKNGLMVLLLCGVSAVPSHATNTTCTSLDHLSVELLKTQEGAKVTPYSYYYEDEQGFAMIESVSEVGTMRGELATKHAEENLSLLLDEAVSVIRSEVSYTDYGCRMDGQIAFGEYSEADFSILEDGSNQYIVIEAGGDYFGNASYREEGSTLFADMEEEVKLDDLFLTTKVNSFVTYDGDMFLVDDHEISLVMTEQNLDHNLSVEELVEELQGYGVTLARQLVQDADGRDWLVKKVKEEDGTIRLYVCASVNHAVYLYSTRLTDCTLYEETMLARSIYGLVAGTHIEEATSEPTTASDGEQPKSSTEAPKPSPSPSPSPSPAPSTEAPAPSTEAPAPSGYYTTDGQAIVGYINETFGYAEGAEYPPCYWSATAEAIARTRAKELVADYSHNGARCPENICTGMEFDCSSRHFFDAWYRSPGHQATMSCSTGTGVGYACWVEDGIAYAVFTLHE